MHTTHLTRAGALGLALIALLCGCVTPDSPAPTIAPSVPASQQSTPPPRDVELADLTVSARDLPDAAKYKDKKDETPHKPGTQATWGFDFGRSAPNRCKAATKAITDNHPVYKEVATSIVVPKELRAGAKETAAASFIVYKPTSNVDTAKYFQAMATHCAGVQSDGSTIEEFQGPYSGIRYTNPGGKDANVIYFLAGKWGELHTFTLVFGMPDAEAKQFIAAQEKKLQAAGLLDR